MIDLPEKLDFSKADWLLESFRSMRGQDLTLSGQSVKFVGTLCAQILQVAATEWKTAGHKLTVDASVAFWADLALLGLKENVLSCVVSK